MGLKVLPPLLDFPTFCKHEGDFQAISAGKIRTQTSSKTPAIADCGSHNPTCHIGDIGRQAHSLLIGFLGQDHLIDTLLACHTRQNSFLLRLCKYHSTITLLCNDARMEYELTCQPLQHVNDNDMYETVMKYVAHRFRGKSISDLTSAEKCSILKHLFFNSRTSIPQLSRILGMPRDLIRRVLST